MPPLTGWFISRARSAGDVLAGYDQIFGVLLALAALGLLSAVVLRRLEARPSD